MVQLDLMSLIPQGLKQAAMDVVVDFVADQARKYAGDELAAKITKLRSDAAFNKAFQEGLQRAARRFVAEYEIEDEDLVAAMAADQAFFQNKAFQAALLAVLKRPTADLVEQREGLVQPFDSLLPHRKNRERVDRAVIYLLKCLAEEVWHLAELQPVYSLQFQRLTAEAAREQVAVQKAQLQALTGLNTHLREALLQLAEAIAEKKALPGDETPALVRPKVYHNLPQPDYGQFVGRDKELAQVVRILRPYPHSQEHLVTIDGIGGIGKSALALEVAQRYWRNYDRIPAEERFEAIIWVSAKQVILTAEGMTSRHQALRTLDDIYTTMAITLEREDITRARPEEQAEVVRKALTRQRTLVIVDNLETVDDEAVLTFLRELPAPTKAIITTRHRMDVAYPVRLIGMPWEDAYQLISQESRKKGVTLSDQEVRHLYNRTGGVPLAIVWSIAQMGFGYSIEAVLTRLGQPISDMAQFCFEGAVECIRDQPAYKLLLALSLFATDASREALGYVAGVPELDRDEGLVELERLSLVNKSRDRFSLLSLVKSYVLGEVEQYANTLEFYQRLVTYYLDLIPAKREAQPSGVGYDDLDLERANILSLLDWCLRSGSEQVIPKILGEFQHFLFAKGYWTDLEYYLEIGLAVCKQYNLVEDEFNLAGSMGRHKYFQAKYEEAEKIVRYAIFLAESIKDIGKAAHVTSYLGLILMSQGKLTEAKQILQPKIEAARATKNLSAISRLETVLAQIDLVEQDYKTARERLEEARILRESTEAEVTGVAVIYRLLGEVELGLGNIDLALKHFSTSLAIAEQIRVATDIAWAKKGLAVVHQKLGYPEKSVQYSNEAVEIFERLGMDHEAIEAKRIL